MIWLVLGNIGTFMKKTAKNGQKAYQFRVFIPEELHRQFKAKVVLSGANMKDVIIEFMEKYVKNGGKA